MNGHIRGVVVFFFQAEDGIRDFHVTGVQTCALPISKRHQLACALDRRTLRHEKNHLSVCPRSKAELMIFLVWACDLGSGRNGFKIAFSILLISGRWIAKMGISSSCPTPSH